MKTKIYLLLLFTLVFGNCYSQTVTLTSTVCGNHQLDFSFVDATGRNFFGGIDDALSWNSSSSQWEWAYYGVVPPVVYYTNAYPSIPNPPCLNAGTWVQANAGCGTLTNITGDCQTGLTDVQNLTAENYFSILPNPASDHLSIILRGTFTENGSKNLQLHRRKNLRAKHFFSQNRHQPQQSIKWNLFCSADQQ